MCEGKNVFCIIQIRYFEKNVENAFAGYVAFWNIAGLLFLAEKSTTPWFSKHFLAPTFTSTYPLN